MIANRVHYIPQMIAFSQPVIGWREHKDHDGTISYRPIWVLAWRLGIDPIENLTWIEYLTAGGEWETQDTLFLHEQWDYDEQGDAYVK